MFEQKIELLEDGKVYVREHLSDSTDNLDTIVAKIEDPNFSVVEVSRLITIELAKLSRDMRKDVNDPSTNWKQKSYEANIKALRELGKQLTETDILSKKDVLNFDGPKFNYVLTEVVGMFKESLKDAGIEESLLNNAMKHFRDKLAMNEQRIRKETEKVRIDDSE